MNSNNPTDDELKKMMDDYFIPSPKDQLYQQLKNPDIKKEKSAKTEPVKLNHEISDSDLKAMMENYLPEETGKKQIEKPEPKEKAEELPTIDLHYKKTDAARSEFRSFIEANIARKNVKKVLVITGKGLGSENFESKLKPMVEDELQIRYAKKIKYFQNAPPNLGGSGAILIFIR